MDFRPRIHVLSQQPASAKAPDLSFEGLLRHFPGLREAESVSFTGSFAAGWANPMSDIDIYAFSDTELTLPVDETMETWRASDRSGVVWSSWIGRYDDVRIDIKVWPTDALDTVLRPFLDAEPEFSNVSPAVEDFLYRVSIAKPLTDPAFVERMKTTLVNSSYARALARWAKAMTENCLTDVAGQLAAGDALGARLSAMNAAAHIADACLIMSGQLSRGRKWLLRRIEDTPDCGITTSEYCSVVLGGQLEGETQAQTALRVARWAQSHHIRIEDRVLSAH